MSNILDKAICLKLNTGWKAIAIRTVRDAFTDLTSVAPGEEETSALAMDLEFGLNPDGTMNYKDPILSTPTEWMDWINLPIRPYDLTISTTRGEIRVPTILISRNFDKMPMIERKGANRRGVMERDKGICQVTRKFVGDRGNLGHVIPKDRGGKKTWENLAWMDPAVNTAMRNRTPDEAGMPLIKRPVAPRPMPLFMTLREAKHPTWTKFVT